MEREPGQRIFGVETEFGTLVVDPELGTPEDAVEAIKDHIFYEMKLGALDLHARDDVFEPARSGGFLLNGGRLYVDAVGSHLEYATAECSTLKELVANDRAGQRQIVRAIKELGLQDHVAVYNNSIDHFGGHTFGCHENYLISAESDFFSERVNLLYPFLVTRQIFAGVGRVGGHILTAGGFRPSYDEVAENPIDYIWVSQVYGVRPDPSVSFQLSQRADHILKTIASRVRFNRALINPKWEHYYTHDGMTRLHILFGEPNQIPYAYALKIGTTCLALDLLERDLIPHDLILANPIEALRSVSRDETLDWLVELYDGRVLRAIEVQRIYLDASQRFRGASADVDWTLDNWELVLAGLERDPLALAKKIDWVAKKTMVETYIREEGLDWQDESLYSLDLEYHNIDPSQSLFGALTQMGEVEPYLDELDVIDAMTDPPRSTRALGRSLLVKHILSSASPRTYMFDWNGVALNRHRYIEMPNPFRTYEDEARDLACS